MYVDDAIWWRIDGAGADHQSSLLVIELALRDSLCVCIEIQGSRAGGILPQKILQLSENSSDFVSWRSERRIAVSPAAIAVLTAVRRIRPPCAVSVQCAPSGESGRRTTSAPGGQPVAGEALSDTPRAAPAAPLLRRSAVISAAVNP